MNAVPYNFSVFNYFDFRRCLDEFYRYRKAINHRFSHRDFARKAGYKSSALLVQLIKGNLKPTDKMMPGLMKALELGELEAEYFGYMVRFTLADSAEAKQLWFEKMTPLLPSQVRIVALEQKRYYERWHNVAVREALSILDVSDDFSELAEFIQPPISEGEAKESVELLRNLGLIRTDGAGYWRATDAILDSTPDLGTFLIWDFQENMIDKGKSALRRYSKDKRNVASFTFSLSEEGHKRLSIKIDSFFKEVFNLVRSDEGMNRVCQLNVQYFPISKEKS